METQALGPQPGGEDVGPYEQREKRVRVARVKKGQDALRHIQDMDEEDSCLYAGRRVKAVSWT